MVQRGGLADRITHTHLGVDERVHGLEEEVDDEWDVDNVCGSETFWVMILCDD